MSVEELYPELRKVRRAALAFALTVGLIAVGAGLVWLAAQVPWVPIALMLGSLALVLTWMVYWALEDWGV